MSKFRGLPLFLLFLICCISSASAVSVRVDDPLTEVHYDVIGPDGAVYKANLNSSEICSLSDGHYTILLHPDPLRVASDPGSFFANMTQYGYAIIFGVFLVFLAGGIAGSFLSVFLRRR